MKILKLFLIFFLITFISSELTEDWQKKNFINCISSSEVPLTEEEKSFDIKNDFELYLNNLKEKYTSYSNVFLNCEETSMKKKVLKGRKVEQSEKKQSNLKILEEKELPKAEPQKPKCIEIKKPIKILEQP
jgi:hypothetical protein